MTKDFNVISGVGDRRVVDSEIASDIFCIYPLFFDRVDLFDRKFNPMQV